MNRRALRPGLYWLRDEDRAHVIVSDDRPPLTLAGADADLFEWWIAGMEPDAVVAEVSLCHRLDEANVHHRFAMLLERLEEAGAIVDVGGLPMQGAESSWPTSS